MSKLDGLKEGDRVRITFEGTVDNFDSSLKVCVCPDNQIGFSWILSELVTSSPAFQIERIEPPLSVGDRVKDSDGDPGSIRAIDGDDFWVFWDKASRHLTCHRNDLERIA